jgi:hypothetical protein
LSRDPILFPPPFVMPLRAEWLRGKTSGVKKQSASAEVTDAGTAKTALR